MNPYDLDPKSVDLQNIWVMWVPTGYRLSGWGREPVEKIGFPGPWEDSSLEHLGYRYYLFVLTNLLTIFNDIWHTVSRVVDST